MTDQHTESETQTTQPPLGNGSELSGLVRRIHSHLGQLPLHVAQRESARLLLEAVERIEQLAAAIDKMPTCKIACDDIVMVPVDRYNAAINIANG